MNHKYQTKTKQTIHSSLLTQYNIIVQGQRHELTLCFPANETDERKRPLDVFVLLYLN